jgi:hypothetical protein
MKTPLIILFALISQLAAQDKLAPNLAAHSADTVSRSVALKPELRLVSPVGTIDARVKQLHEAVSLTPEQETKIKAVLVKNDTSMKAAVAAFRASPSKESRQKLSALMKAQDAEINALLTEEQKTKGQAAQNVSPSPQKYSPGTTGPGANRLTPGMSNVRAAPPSANAAPVTTK